MRTGPVYTADSQRENDEPTGRQTMTTATNRPADTMPAPTLTYDGAVYSWTGKEGRRIATGLHCWEYQAIAGAARIWITADGTATPE